MDLALVLYDDIAALGVEYFFELARSVCDLSPNQFEQFYNEFRSRSTLSTEEFTQLIITYLSERNMLDLMNRAAEIHNKALRGLSLSVEWIDVIEAIFEELDFGMTYLLSWNEVALLGVALARGQIRTWVGAKQNAMRLLEFCGRSGSSPRLSKRALKNAMKMMAAPDVLLREVERSIRNVSEHWKTAGFGDVSMAQLATIKAISAHGHHLSLRLKNGLKDFLEQFFCGRLYTVPEPTNTSYADSLYRLSLMMFQRFSQDYQYSVVYLSLEQLLRDAVFTCIANALVNYECICNELVFVLNSNYASRNDDIRLFVPEIALLDGVVSQAQYEVA